MALGWTEGFQHNGNYYEGWVEDNDARLSPRAKATVTCYGTHRSQKPLVIQQQPKKMSIHLRYDILQLKILSKLQYITIKN